MNESRLTNALDKRFDDLEEIKDVANHGCEGGVSDFIYYSETREFFNEYDAEIEQDLSDIYGDDSFSEIACLPSITDTIQFKNHCVWVIVEIYCQAKLEEHEIDSLIAKCKL